MKKQNVLKVFNTIKRVVGKKSPEILIGFGIAGMITTVGLAIKATGPALKKIEAEQIRQNEEHGHIVKIKHVDAVRAAWKCYIPTIITGSVSIACIIGANTVHSKRKAAIATAYKLSEKAFTEYKGAVLEEFGEEKEKVIRDKVAEKNLAEHPVTNTQVIVTGIGKQLCYDGISGRYFESDIETIRAAVNRLNRTLTYDMYVSLSEFYDELGLEHTSVSDELGWNIDQGCIEIDYGSRIANDGRPCLTIDYLVAPKYDFSTLM